MHTEPRRNQEKKMQPLVRFDGGRYVVHEPTLAWLSEQSGPFAVLACAGKFRTGKSFLLNRLLRRAPGEGFGVGETVQACTRGLWVCTDFLEEPAGGTRVLVVDTEGIDALDAESEHDVKVFALAVLLSSVLVYNSMSHLDEAAVQTLSLMTRVAEAVGDASHAPTLYWVLRDFALQLADTAGNPLSHADYLEQALAADGKCATRAAIRRVFPGRHLVTLPRPHKGDSAQRLDAKGPSALQPKFDKFLDQMRTHVCANAAPVRAAGVALSGAVYADYVRTLVDALNAEGAVPKLSDAWTLLARAQHADAERLLLRETEAVCPAGSEEEVRAWATAAVAGARLMPPVDESLAARLVDAVVHHARALGRVEDAAARARRRAAGPWERFVASGYTDGTALLTDTDEGVRAALLAQVVAEGLSEAARLNTARGAEEASLAVATAKAEGEDARAAGAAAEERASALSAELDVLRRPPAREEAATQTEDCDEGSGVEEEEGATAWRLRAEEAEARAAAAARARDEGAAREARMREAFDEGMEALRAETVAQLEEARGARDVARAEARTAADQRASLGVECDKLRAAAREAQETVVEAHRAALDASRRRDTETRALADATRREHATVVARAEVSAAEARATKRRVDELVEEAADAKRLRTERARDEGEREALRAQLTTARSEAEALRAVHVELASKVAVLEATAKLASCKRDLTTGGR